MHLLILGGTLFLGRHLAEAALARGWRVTLFHRGRTNPDILPNATHLLGDRTEDLSALAGGSWDAVIDTSGYHPPVVQAAADALADAVRHYTFISSISVYPDLEQPGLTEDAAVSELPDGVDASTREITGETYGPLKALCEQAVREVFVDQALIVRPGLIVGPHDPSDRFSYWPTRVARGGQILAPGRPERLVQVIDARDLADWTLDLVARQAQGTFNATGPDRPLSMAEILAVSAAVSGSDAQLTWVADDFLTEAGVAAYTEMPLWIPHSDDSVSIARALAAGLTFRPLADTIRDTLAWDATRPVDAPRRSGMAPAKESELLEAWRAQQSGN